MIAVYKYYVIITNLMINNKAISPIIATVLLITLAVVVGTLILKFGNEYLKQLSPPADCSQVNFEAGIYLESNGDLTLEVSNIGNIKIDSFTIKIKDENENTDLKEIPISVAPSESIRQIPQFTISENSDITIIPHIKNTQDKIVQCPEEFGKPIFIR